LADSLDVPAHLVELDVRDRAAVSEAIGKLPAEFAEIDVLVNNAGLAAGLESVQDGDPDNWDRMLGLQLPQAPGDRALRDPGGTRHQTDPAMTERVCLRSHPQTSLALIQVWKHHLELA
ncbi:MAG: SDR family NAD(P)-dependent oxidoreductase, partial [Actinophytocola sp.]|nr:SDR family NAD(P)-dependent oxidoreductase [Actinophytocola sp.]